MRTFVSVSLILLGIQSAWAAGERRSIGRFQVGAVGIVQGTGQNYTGALTWNPTLLSLGPLGLDLMAEGILAKRTGGTYFAIASGGGALHLNLGSRLRLTAGALYSYWSATNETILSPYGALAYYWNKTSFFQGLSGGYSFTDQTWGRAHIVRFNAVVAF